MCLLPLVMIKISEYTEYSPIFAGNRKIYQKSPLTNQIWRLSNVNFWPKSNLKLFRNLLALNFNETFDKGSKVIKNINIYCSLKETGTNYQHRFVSEDTVTLLYLKIKAFGWAPVGTRRFIGPDFIGLILKIENYKQQKEKRKLILRKNHKIPSITFLSQNSFFSFCSN